MCEKKTRKKNVGAEIWNGLLPNVLQKERVLYCNSSSVLQVGRA